MRTRMLGGLEVPAVGFGAMVLSPGLYGDVDDARGERALHAAIDAGATFIDTSDGYGPDGHNESLVGRAVAGRRERVRIATKFGFRIPPGAEAHRFPVGFAFGELAVNAEPRFVRGYAEDSLRRLGTDHIDLLYPHFPDPAVPITETVGAIADLVRDGLVGHIGLSNVTAAQLGDALTVHPVAAVQTEWSMWRPVDPDLLAVARGAGVGVVAWSPLGAGFLADPGMEVGAGDFRRNVPRFTRENLAVNRDRYAPLRGLADEAGVTPAQLALAWLLARGPDVVPIPGSRTPAHIRENTAAADVALDDDLLGRLDDLLGSVQPVGETLI